MGNACSCFAGLDQHDHHAVRYGDVPKYAGPGDRLQQAPVSLSTALEQQKSSSSPRKQGRDAPSLALDQSEQQHADEQQGLGQQQQWHSPSAAERQQQQQYLQAAGAAPAGAFQAEEDEIPLPSVPFSWTKGELIGIGAFGRVYTALNNETGELVAVKQVSFAKDEALQGRVAEHIRALEAEVDVLKTLKHDNIVRYLGTERTDDALHIFLEYVPGGSIASLLTRFGAFPESVIRVYTAQLLRGLEYLHAKGIMHRDIKGANILIDKHGTVKLADFGASKKIEDLATVGSGSKSIRGTPYWMAPEVIKQTGHGRPADIWSLACTVIEMATGKPPWSTYTAPVAAMFQIASSKDPPPLPEHLSLEAKDFLLLCFNRVARDRANASRLLKHPFVTKVQLPQSLPFPSSSPNNGISNNGSPAPQRAASGLGRSPHSAANPAGSAGPGQQANRADQRQPHTPTGMRQGSIQPALGGGGNSSSSFRHPGMGSSTPGGMSSGGGKSRCSPQSNAHGSPRRLQPLTSGTGDAQADAASAGMSQRGDASAVVTTVRTQQQQQLKQQDDLPASKQQQQQSPRPFDMYSRGGQQQQQQQQQQPLQMQQQQQQQGRRSITPRSGAAGPSGQDNHMTLVDWNPMVEPSWAPGTYQVPVASSRRNQPSTNEQQHQQTPGRSSSNGSNGRPSGQSAAEAAAAVASPAVAHTKRAMGSAAAGGSSILAGNSSSTRSNMSMNGRKLDAPAAGTSRSSHSSNGASGPLAQGPVGRASRENGFGASVSAAAAAAAGVAANSSLQGAAGAGSRTNRGIKGWAAAPAAAVGSQQPGNGVRCSSSSTSGSPARSGSAASASGSACEADGEDSCAAGKGPNNTTAAAGAGQAGGRSVLQQGAEASSVSLSSKHAQWEHELYEELARHREEQRASRAAGQAAARRSALQQQQ